MFRLRLFKTIQWKLVVMYMLLILIAMQFIGAYFSREVESYYTNTFTETLNAQATLLSVHLERNLSLQRDDKAKSTEDMKEGIEYLISNLVVPNGAKIQVVDQNGYVISTTENEKTIVGQRTSQPEVTIALLGTRNEALRIDPVTGNRVKVLAVPVKGDNVVYGAVYLMAPMEELYTTIRKITSILATGTGIALLFTAVLGVVLARTITIPVKEMTDQAQAVADGDFNRTVKIHDDDEIGHLGLAFNHMTERLREAILEQEEEKEKLASILGNMSDGVVATNRDGQIILLNRSAEEMLQTRLDDVVAKGKTLYELLKLPPEEEMPLFEQGEAKPLMIEMMLANREIVMLRVTFTELKQDSGKKGGIIAVLQDVTEQFRLEQQRREFVANVSHELRTPLTTIKSYVEALVDGAADDKEISSRFLQVTMSETERMIRLVNDLLQLSRFDSQGVPLHRKPLDLGKVLAYAVDRFAMVSEQQEIELSLDIEEAMPAVFADQDALNQVLDNLLSNAIKYTPGGGQVTVQARVNSHKERIYISIIDTGIGISSRDQKRIFDRFYRVDKARSREKGGTGLGLAIARELVKAHGASIEIKSEVNEGTNVTFWLAFAKGGEGA